MVLYTSCHIAIIETLGYEWDCAMSAIEVAKLQHYAICCAFCFGSSVDRSTLAEADGSNPTQGSKLCFYLVAGIILMFFHENHELHDYTKKLHASVWLMTAFAITVSHSS